jgi:hypothetical protein
VSKLTNAAKGQSCIKCGAPDAYFCHLNGPRQHSYGKAKGIKGHDLIGADFCYKCDQEFTEGSMLPKWINKWERSEEFLHWCMLTILRRVEQGIIK